ncbi:MAG: hypothetical protein WAR39_03600 [Prevotella sp.]
MLYLVLILIVGTLIAAIIGLVASHKGEENPIHIPEGSCATCNGVNDLCEQTCTMIQSTKEIEYFNDEELDAYKGRLSDQYTDEEVAAFSEVLYTMNQKEVKDWNRSLILRGINLPDQLKDEVILLISNN